MTKEEFHYRGDNENELDAFEQQLRSIKPTPPKMQWQDMPQMPERQPTLSASSRTSAAPVAHSTTRWLRIATHAAATLIGIGIGAICVLALQPEVVATQPDNVDPAPSQFAMEQERPDAAPTYSPVQQSVRRWQFQTSWPLTPLTGSIEPWPRHRLPNDLLPVSLETPAATFEPDQLGKPMSAPELMREMLNKQAQDTRSGKRQAFRLIARSQTLIPTTT